MDNIGTGSAETMSDAGLTSRAAAEILAQAVAGGQVDARTLLAAILRLRSVGGAHYLTRPFQVGTTSGAAIHGVQQLVPENQFRKSLIIVYVGYAN